MDNEDRQAIPHDEVRKPVRGKGCFVAVSLILLLLVSGVVRISRPRFESSVPVRIEVRASQFKGNEDYTASTTKRDACLGVIGAFKKGSLVLPCMCKRYARFQIHYESGAVDDIELLSGHSGQEFYQIRQGLWQYRLPRKALGQMLKGSGLDESKIFAYEYIYSETEPKQKNQAEQVGGGDGDKPPN